MQLRFPLLGRPAGFIGYNKAGGIFLLPDPLKIAIFG